jgi:hypothetical protein
MRTLKDIAEEIDKTSREALNHSMDVDDPSANFNHHYERLYEEAKSMIGYDSLDETDTDPTELILSVLNCIRYKEEAKKFSDSLIQEITCEVDHDTGNNMIDNAWDNK